MMPKSDIEKESHDKHDETSEKVLDQFVSFLKANWKTLLKEIVLTGVTTYIAFRGQRKNKKKD